MKTIITNFLVSAFLCLTLMPLAMGQLNVSPIFGSDMVLQRGTTVPVFGSASPGASVSVQFLSQNKSAVADGSGNWQVVLSGMSANTSMNSMTISSGSDVVTFTGVQVGEVWVCSGQSNMAWELSQADDGSAAIAESGNYNIRLFRMDVGNGPATTTWEVAGPSTSSDFSAVGWWMGKELSQWFGNVPVGLIQATHDGTAIDQWTHTNGGSAADYEAMVKPIQPYAIKGVAWYQGESNGGDSSYDVLLTDMINEWRTDWALPNLPFGIVQLAGTSRSGGARLGQYVVSQTVPDTYLVVIADLPGGSQLHPTTKKPVGLRTAIGARGAVYGENIPYSGPVVDAVNSHASGSTVILHWDFVGNGLITSDGLAPSTFQVAGSDGRFKSATATIVGNTVELASGVTSPVTIRYQFGSVGNLFNSLAIPIEGGAGTLDRLPTSMFELTLGAPPSNIPPMASFMHSVAGLSATFDATASADSDGTISAWEWSFGDGTTGSGEQVNHTYSTSGNYTVTLTVTDDGGATGSDAEIVSVSDGNSFPVASFSFSTNLLAAGFDGSASSDSDGSIVSYSWDFGDGNSASGETATHSYASSGTYSVSLTVTDDGGAVDSEVQSVSVSDGSSPGSIHVESVVTYTLSAGKGQKYGVARVTIHDDQENPVANAMVTGTFSGTFNETVTGSTLSDGTVELQTANTASGGVTVDLCVDNVTHGSLGYNASANDITCTGGGARTTAESGTAVRHEISVYPNPSSDGQFSIFVPKVDAPVELGIYGLDGRIIYRDRLVGNGTIQRVNLSLRQGFYLLRLESGAFKFEKKLIIQ